MSQQEQSAVTIECITTQPCTANRVVIFEQYPDVVSIENIMNMLNIGKNTAYSLIRSGQIRHVKIGRKYVIPKHSVIDFLTNPCYNSSG